MSFDVGDLLGGKYTLVRLLGRGSAGEVWEAEHTLVERRVAIKILHRELADDAEIYGRFIAEARAAGRLMHPNVAGVFDLGDQDGAPFMVMELCDGELLSTVIEERGAVGVGYACELIAQVLAALEAAHGLGIVHRDLKPGNIIVVHPRPDQPLTKVLDFGIAKGVHPDGMAPEETGRIFGTPSYMAPEQALGESVDHRADLYATGAILYELLTGRPPFEGASALDVIATVIRRPPKPLRTYAPQVPAELELVVRRALAKDRRQRQQSAAEMLRAIAPFIAAAPAASHDHRTIPPLPLVSRPASPEAAPPPSAARPLLQLVADSTLPPPPEPDR
ncbi:MAG: serine/threonine-protein kinase [Sorangiineae bacterium]|nr:serine/threonine-protein kinase [Polyangiaceae bacterium]MEB2321044.1 serine/threonine-protein kinase [Sorangiineae bacterium]